MTQPILMRLRHDDQVKLGLQIDDNVYDVTSELGSVAAFLQRSAGRIEATISDVVTAALRNPPLFQTKDLETINWLAPTDSQDIWAAGVTYEHSRNARQEESQDGGDVYARVYTAERPEIFFKGHGTRVIGHLGEVGIRSDSHWNVPEPELGLVLNPALEVVGLTIGNDMSSRDIEGANPLYLPQAKVYNASCALGPGIVLGSHSTWPIKTIDLEIIRQNSTLFSSQIQTSRIHRTIQELLEHLGRCTDFPDGAVLLTGTGIIPPSEFTLQVGDSTRISIDGIGTLVNRVKQV
ncbi:MAG: fumarylacetoacetate hydrolase family protein [Chloroflexota bacterium]